MSSVSARHPPREDARLLVTALGELGEADLGALRRATGQPLGSDVVVYDIFRALFHTIRRHYPARKWVCYFIATLYPWHRKPDGKGSLADNLLRVRKGISDQEGRKRADERFLQLLDSRDRPALLARLASCIRLLAKEDIAVYWVRLFTDLNDWYRSDQRIQREWSATYFGS